MKQKDKIASRKGMFVGIATVLALTVVIVINGTRASETISYPTNSDEGASCSLHITKDGGKEVVCSMVLEHPREKVWQIVTDYAHFPEIFITKLWQISDVSVVKQGETVQLKGTFSSLPLDTNFEATVTHRIGANENIASWDTSSGSLRVNRGRWLVRSLTDDKTLLSYQLELEVSPYPSLLVRNVLLGSLAKMPKLVAKTADKRKVS